MSDDREVWETLLEEAIAIWEAAPEMDHGRVPSPTEWVVDCIMGCYNFTEPEEEA